MSYPVTTFTVTTFTIGGLPMFTKSMASKARKWGCRWGRVGLAAIAVMAGVVNASKGSRDDQPRGVAKRHLSQQFDVLYGQRRHDDRQGRRHLEQRPLQLAERHDRPQNHDRVCLDSQPEVRSGALRLRRRRNHPGA